MKNSLINFKNPQEVGPSAVTLAALLILAGSLSYMLLVPKPTTDGLARGKERSRKQILEQIESAQASGQAAQAATAGKLWQGDTDTISAAILAQLTQEANLLKVKVSAFRPQRTLTLPELTELPFTVQLAGPYPAIQAFAASLDRPSSKLALRSIQLASSDASSDAVTVTLGVSAYVSGQVVVTPKKPMVPTMPATPVPSKGGTSNGQAQ